MTRALIFPGQGSQTVGMGKALAEVSPAAREVFEVVDEALGQNLSEIMWNGPLDVLTLTENAQPALMAASMAVVRCLEKEHGFNLQNSISYIAGHSLGEYSALAAAGALSIRQAALLLKLRGKAMQKAVPVGKGAMAALLGVNREVAEKVVEKAAEGEVCQIANDNDPLQVVVSGSKTAIDRVIALGKEFGVRRAVQLPVSAPFHCALMQPAADAMAIALNEVEMKPPSVLLIANVRASPLTDPGEIKRSLVEQVTGTVRWRECVTYMTANGVTDFYEVGSGKVLAGLVKRIDKTANATSLQTLADIEAVATELNA